MHTIKTWAKAQSLIAKSTGEAELYGTVRGSCEGLGLQSLYGDFGVKAALKVYLDANAAKGIVERKGLCKVRRIDVEHLWLQQQQTRRMLPLTKILGSVNPADLMTKCLPAKDIMKYLDIF